MPTRNAVCLCIDRKMLIPALFVADAIKSKAAGSARQFEIIIFTGPSDASDAHRRWMAEQGIEHCDSLDTSRLNDIVMLQGRLTSATLVKLLLAGHLAGRYDKILYLDADMTIHDDLSPIFDLDTGEFPLAAVPSARIWVDRSEEDRLKTEEHFRALGMTAPYRFFNTGVLLIDVEKWNRRDVGARALGLIRRIPEICFLPDEHALNGVLDGRFAELSPIWNMRPGQRATHKIAHPVIIHHTGEDKPWRRYGYRKRLFPGRAAYRLYKSFLKNTPWAGWLDEQWSGRDLHKTFVWEVRRITRRLRGKLDEPSRRQRRDYVDAFRSYCATGDFADVAQGIAIRQDGTILLKKAQAVAA